MKRFWHKLAHLFGWTMGDVYSYSWWEDGYGKPRKLMIGFRCSKCETIEGVHESVTTRQEHHGL